MYQSQVYPGQIPIQSRIINAPQNLNRQPVIIQPSSRVIQQSPIKQQQVDANAINLVSTPPKAVRGQSSPLKQTDNNFTQNNQYLEQVDEDDEVKEDNYYKKRFGNILIFVCPLFFTLVMLICSFIIIGKDFTSKNDLHNAGHVMDYVNQNLNRDPITQILTTQKQNCDSGTSQESLGEWPGVDRGCICDDGKRHDTSYCTYNWKGCQFVGDREPYELDFWNKNTKICVVKNNEWVKQLSCDSDQKQCFENICTQKDQQCGENVINQEANGKQLVVASLKNIFKQDMDTHSTSFKIDDFFYRSEYDYNLSRTNTPIVQLAVTTGQAPCLNPQFAPNTQSGKAYPLLKQVPSGCDEYGDLQAYSIPLRTMKLQDLYNDNGLEGIFDGIPEYSKFSDPEDLVSLIAIKRIKVKPSEECQSVEYGDFTIVKEFSGFGRGVLLFFAWILLLACLLTIVFAVLYVLRALKKIPVSFEEQKTLTLQAYFYSAFLIAGIAIFLGIIYHFAFSNNVSDVIDRMKGYLQYTCFYDNGINRALKAVIDYNEESGSVYQTVIHFIVYFSFLYIIFWGIVYYLWKQKKSLQFFGTNSATQQTFFPK